MKIPARTKTIDEAFKPLFIFGNRADTGECDIHADGGEYICSLPKEVAEKVIEINDRYMVELYGLLGFKD